jgi:hypothetical protein
MEHMTHYAGALFSVVVLGGLAAAGASCDNGSTDLGTSSAGAASIAGSPAIGGSAPVVGAAGTAGSAVQGTTATAGAGGASSGNTAASDALPASAVEVALVPSTSGFVNDVTGVIGAWYAYGDGNDGASPGVCQSMGMHVTAECSVIEAPIPGMPFAPMGNSQMCTTGTVAKVINFGEPPALDYSNIFGAGIGLDLNNPGLDGGTGVKMPFNAQEKKIVGIAFDLDAVPASGLRVEFPFGSASTAAGVWKPNKSTYASPVSAGHNVLLFSSVTQPGYVKAADMVPFDPSTLTSIQFHVPTNTTAAAPYHFCIDKLSLIVQM